MKNNYTLLIILILLIIGCKQKNKTEQKDSTVTIIKKIDKKSEKIRNSIKKDIIIAHRGSTYWTPEETEAAYRWARNIGADYLELDIQMTKDSILIALHDNDLSRTTNVFDVFPKRKKSSTLDFTLKELRGLDAGTWFNKANPTRARKKFKDLKIVTLQDVIMIAEGFQIKKENNKPIKELENGKWNGKYQYEKDPKDNGNRPGIYVETKHPKLDIEKRLSDELSKLGWNINTNPKEIKTNSNKIGIANTNARLILQSFSTESIEKLEKHLPNIPKCFLLWRPDMKGNIKVKYQEVINFAIKNKTQIIGTSIAGEPNNYEELTAPWMTELIHKSGMLIHPYSFDTNKQLSEYKNHIDGIFTNRADLALEFYNRANQKSSQTILKELGY